MTALPGRVGLALAFHELLERTRDRWVLIISVLFALLASAVSLYGNSTEGAEVMTGPSLVTLASLLVPLVALVLGHDAVVGERERNTFGLLLSLPVGRYEVVIAKFVGRGVALVFAVSLGLGAAIVIANEAQRPILIALIGPTLLLGLSFMSIGLLISTIARRQVTAASLVVVVWFLLVFLYDLALLTLLVVSDGDIAQQTIADLVAANPAGLYRVQMMRDLSGPDVLEGLGMTATMPAATWVIWAAWIIVPVLLSGALLSMRRVIR